MSLFQRLSEQLLCFHSSPPIFGSILVSSFMSNSGCRCQGIGSGVFQGAFLRGEAGAALFWTQLALTDPPQGTAEPWSQDSSTWGKTKLKKHKKTLHRQWGKKCYKQPCEPQSQQRRRGGGVSSAKAEGAPLPGKGPCQSKHFPRSLRKTAYWSKQVFPKGTAAWGEPALEQVYPEWLQLMEGPVLKQGQSMRTKEQQRRAVMDRTQPHSSSPLRCSEGEEREEEDKLGMKEWSSA